MMGGTAACEDDVSLTQKNQDLARLREILGASSVIWLDGDGHLRGVIGHTTALELPIISVLAAGVMAAARGLNQLFGNLELHQMSLEGDGMTLYFHGVSPQGGLLVIACPKATPLGLIRLHARRAAQNLREPSSVDTASLSASDDLYRASA